jgi:hypothetical protein
MPSFVPGVRLSVVTCMSTWPPLGETTLTLMGEGQDAGWIHRRSAPKGPKVTAGSAMVARSTKPLASVRDTGAGCQPTGSRPGPAREDLTLWSRSELNPPIAVATNATVATTTTEVKVPARRWFRRRM